MDTSNMTIEELALEYEKADIGQKELMAAIIILKEEILSRMKNDEELAGEIVLKKKKGQTTFNPSLEWAAEMGAVKTVLDTEKLHEIAKTGVAIPTKVGKPGLIYSRVK